MNDKEIRDEENLARLIRAGFNRAARPDPSARGRILRHLTGEWRAEYGSAARLEEQLDPRNQASVKMSSARAHQEQTPYERSTIMSKLLQHRWGFGLGAAAGAAAIVLVILLAFPKTQATAAEVMTKGAQAVARLTSIHLRGQLRADPVANFDSIDPDAAFCTIELWKQFEPETKWRYEKPGRVAVWDGQSFVMFLKTANIAAKGPMGPRNPFNKDWLHQIVQIANLSNTITNELNNAIAKGWKISHETGRADDGRLKDVVTIEAKSGRPDNDYLNNRFFDAADTRRIYVFDDQSGLLESVKIYLQAAAGDKLIFELDQIDYNQSFNPSLFQIELPADVSLVQNEMQKLPDNEKYAALTAEQAARAYIEALGRQDWTEAEKFRRMTIDDRTKKTFGGLELVSIGESFTAKDYPGRFVPYVIKLRSGEMITNNLGFKKDGNTDRWWDDSGCFVNLNPTSH
jgi:outer membrane lipoprotein-sorting protein